MLAPNMYQPNWYEKIILLQNLAQYCHKSISKLRSKYLNLNRFEKPEVTENENLATDQIPSDLCASETVQVDRQPIFEQDNLVVKGNKVLRSIFQFPDLTSKYY